jgi:hypothetical protein
MRPEGSPARKYTADRSTREYRERLATASPPRKKRTAGNRLGGPAQRRPKKRRMSQLSNPSAITPATTPAGKAVRRPERGWDRAESAGTTARGWDRFVGAVIRPGEGREVRGGLSAFGVGQSLVFGIGRLQGGLRPGQKFGFQGGGSGGASFLGGDEPGPGKGGGSGAPVKPARQQQGREA